MDRSRLFARLPVLGAVMLLAAPAFAQDQPKDQTKTAPPVNAATQAKPVAAKPAPAAPTAAPPHVVTPKKDADSLLGKEVFGADGHEMGLVTNVLIDRDGHPIAVVIDFGGFLGVGTRKIAIDWHLMQFHPGNKDKPVTLSLSKDQLKSAPEYKADSASAQIVHAPAPTPPPTAKPAAPDKGTPAPDHPTPPPPDRTAPK
jgi:sporulation protein YlmC with PRC-barrel domain